MNQTPRNQMLHIFAKDARRFWIEVLTSLALLAAFAHISPRAYQPGMMRPEFVLYPVFNVILYILIPIAWWVLISRVVHEENLVGDSQFWITRPYRWPSLLGAKVLFLVAFILVPVALTQAAILFTTGFHVAALVPGLFFSVALFGILVILPLFALSTLTVSFAKLTITLLGIFLSVFLFGTFIASQATNIDTSVHLAWPYILLSFAASAAIVLVQYARRRTVISRFILVGSLILLILFPVFFATTLTPLFFPAVSASRPAPVAFAYDSNPARRFNGAEVTREQKFVSLSLPVVVSGVASNSLAVAESMKITLTSSSGETYSGPWRSDLTYYRPENNNTLQYLSLLVPASFMKQVGSSPVTAHITLGVGQLKPQAVVTLPFPHGKTEIPGIGICSGSGNGAPDDPSSYSLACTTALRNPAYTEATARWSDYPCNRSQPPVDQLIRGDATIGNFDSDPAEFGLSPVIHQQLGFSNGTVPLPNNATRPRYLCAGTPLTFTPYILSYRTSVDLTAPNLNLAEYFPKASGPPATSADFELH